MKEVPGLLGLLEELNHLDYLPRTGYLLRGIALPESIAEHSFHVGFLVWVVGLDEDLDLAKALGMALLHDLAEVRLGDIPRPATRFLAREHKVLAETKVMEDLLSPLNEKAKALWDEFQAGEVREARFVKACDEMQFYLKSAHYLETGHLRMQQLVQNADSGRFEEFPGLMALFEEWEESLRNR